MKEVSFNKWYKPEKADLLHYTLWKGFDNRRVLIVDPSSYGVIGLVRGRSHDHIGLVVESYALVTTQALEWAFDGVESDEPFTTRYWTLDSRVLFGERLDGATTPTPDEYVAIREYKDLQSKEKGDIK